VRPGLQEPRIAGEDEATRAGLQVQHQLLRGLCLGDDVLRMQRSVLRVAKIPDRGNQRQRTGDGDRKQDRDGDREARGQSQAAPVGKRLRVHSRRA
jgi:hypothetical protein